MFKRWSRKHVDQKRKEKLSGTNLCGLSAIKLAISAGSKIYANKQRNEDGDV